MNIVKLATYDNRLSHAEATALAKSNGLRLITNEESLALDSDKQYDDCRPYWTGTYAKYEDGTKECKVWNEGEKPTSAPLPLEDGWYLTGSHGLPNGKKSEEGNSKARKLWRWQDRSWEGPLVRGWDDWGDSGCRDVDAGLDASGRGGVLAVSDAAKPRTCKDEKKETKKPTYCAGCSFKCQASDCICRCHERMRRYYAQKRMDEDSAETTTAEPKPTPKTVAGQPTTPSKSRLKEEVEICPVCKEDKNSPVEVIILDNNPISIACYFDEFDEKCERCGRIPKKQTQGGIEKMDDEAMLKRIYRKTVGNWDACPNFIQTALKELAKRDAQRDEELVEGLAKWMLEKDSSSGLRKIAIWDSQDETNRKHYLEKAHAAIKSAREVKK